MSVHIRVVNGTVLDVEGLEPGQVAVIWDQDLVDEAEMATLTKSDHPRWGPAIKSVYDPRLTEPWR